MIRQRRMVKKGGIIHLLHNGIIPPLFGYLFFIAFFLLVEFPDIVTHRADASVGYLHSTGNLAVCHAFFPKIKED